MSSLSKHLRKKRAQIFLEFVKRLEQHPQTDYLNFLIHTQEGKRRIKLWINLLINSVEGKQQALFDDQKKIGYTRAIQGYSFSHTSIYYPIIAAVLNDLLVMIPDTDKMSFFNDCLRLMEYNLQSYNIISNSYMHTREEIIEEKVFYLEELFAFTKEIVSTQDFVIIINILLKKIHRLLKIENCYFMLSLNNVGSTIHGYPLGQPSKSILKLMEKSCNESIIIFGNGAGCLIKSIADSKEKKLVTVPVQLRDKTYGVIALAGTKPFVFTSKELDLLNQIIYIAAIALDNALMFREIEQSHRQLRFLTEKIINIQEEERKRIASDIHDSLAQQLAGIGFKIEYCKEHLGNTETLSGQLNVLTGMVNKAITQSREMIATLRPVLIDTSGLVAAIKRLIDNFIAETGILVEPDLPGKIVLQSSLSICVYRVLQEALSNIYKHSSATSSRVVLKERKKVLLLTISDNGKGFDISSGLSPMVNQNKLGLIFIKERVEAVNGHFNIHSGIDKGCQIEISIPINGEDYLRHDQGDACRRPRRGSGRFAADSGNLQQREGHRRSKKRPGLLATA
jgi:signal transduction histidine kinase